MRVLDETRQIVPPPILATVARPNHWHLVVRPEASVQVNPFFRRLTVLDMTRCHAHDKTSGTVHLYQGPISPHADAPGQQDQFLASRVRISLRCKPTPTPCLRRNFIPWLPGLTWQKAPAQRHDVITSQIMSPLQSPMANLSSSPMG